MEDDAGIQSATSRFIQHISQFTAPTSAPLMTHKTVKPLNANKNAKRGFFISKKRRFRRFLIFCSKEALISILNGCFYFF